MKKIHIGAPTFTPSPKVYSIKWGKNSPPLHLHYLEHFGASENTVTY